MAMTTSGSSGTERKKSGRKPRGRPGTEDTLEVTQMEAEGRASGPTKRAAAAKARAAVAQLGASVDVDVDSGIGSAESGEDAAAEASADDESEAEISEQDTERPTKRPKRAPKKSNVAEITAELKSDDPFENHQLNFGVNPFLSTPDSGNQGFRKIANSLRDKMMHLFGFDHKRLAALMKLQDETQSNFFHLSLAQISQLHLNKLTSGPIGFAPARVVKLSFDSYSSLLSLKKEINFDSNDSGGKSIKLSPGAATWLAKIDPAAHREAILLNCGGIPIDVAWSQSDQDAELQYFALSVSGASDLTDPRFSIYNASQKVDGFNALTVYGVSPKTLEIKLVRSYLCKFGVASNLKWYPFHGSGDGVIGVIAAIFGDGKLRFVKVSNNDPQFCELVDASKTFEVPDTKITCFDYVSNHSIVFGTQNGYIGEIDLKSDSISYLYPLLTQAISSCTTNVSDFYHDASPTYSDGEYVLKTKMVVVASADLHFVVDLNDVVNQKTDVVKPKTLITDCAYVPQVHSFVVNDGSRATKLFSKRDCQTSLNFLKTNSITSGLAASRLHSLVLTGSTDGEIITSDALKRVLPVRKSEISTKFPIARILRVEYSSKNDCFRIETKPKLDLVTGKEYDSTFTFNSSKVSVSAIAWNENPAHAHWYAATTLGGLVVVSKLPTYKTIRHYNGAAV